MRTAMNERRLIIIPAYNEAANLPRVLPEIRAAAPEYDIVVVDDGSRDATAALAAAHGAAVVSLPANLGYGGAVQTGFRYAVEHGYAYGVMMDADGQHLPAEVPKFVDAYRRTGIPVLIGNRMWNPEGMPLVRRLTNRFMSALLSRLMRQYVPDTQCGFRLYRCDDTQRFDAESEILLNIAAHGIRMGSVRISSVYADEKSKIRPVSDTLRFIKMLIRVRRAQHNTGETTQRK